MAKYKFKLPDIGEGIAEAEIVAWHVKVGDEIEEDQGIADMMTDKATVEMESPVTGKVIELNGEEGDMLAIGSVLAVIETDEIPDEEEDPPAAAAKLSEERAREEAKAAAEAAAKQAEEAAAEPVEEAPVAEEAPEPDSAPSRVMASRSPIQIAPSRIGSRFSAS